MRAAVERPFARLLVAVIGRSSRAPRAYAKDGFTVMVLWPLLSVFSTTLTHSPVLTLDATFTVSSLLFKSNVLVDSTLPGTHLERLTLVIGLESTVNGISGSL